MKIKCIVRIPMASWAVNYFLSQNRHKLAPDGITIQHTAKDMIGKIVTGYMRKSTFDNCTVPTGSHLRIALPANYFRYGLLQKDIDNLTSVLEHIAKKDICYKVAVIACMPGVSRSHSIRVVFEKLGISDEEYDQGHFRRYFDRYGKESIGAEFKEFRKEVTRTLKEIYGPMVAEMVE